MVKSVAIGSMCLWFSLLFSLSCSCEAFFKTKAVLEKEEETEKYIEDLGLVGMVGHFLFDSLQSYRWYFKLATGYWLDKEMTVMTVSIVCNLIYCFSVVVGMFLFKQDAMLLYGLLTVFVGPAVVLFGIGVMVLGLALMALYPMISVTILLVSWFCTSRLGQIVGRRLGLDYDNDGDVDLADFVHWLNSKLGQPKWLPLSALYRYLQKREKSPELEGIDELREQVKLLTERVEALTKQSKAK